MLYPQSNIKRQVMDLNGIWRFQFDDGSGLPGHIYKESLKDTIPMPVPASYNDLVEQLREKEHVGNVWYERTVSIPEDWRNRRIVLRFGSVTHYGKVWVNGQEVMEHRGGYTPFEGDISPYVHFDRDNRITVLVNNELDMTTIPVGEIEIVQDKNGQEVKKQNYFHDFFNYSGIHRPVQIYTTAQEYVKDITIRTELEKEAGIVHYEIDAVSSAQVKVSVIDEAGNTVCEADGLLGTMRIAEPVLWNPGAAYLYTLRVQVLDSQGSIRDLYDEPFGIRTVKVEGHQFLINGKPFYFKGFGKHEDADHIGKGLSDVINVKDFSLMKWSGANSFRTSHYPYSEEIMRMADREGFVVVDEVAAVGLHLTLGGVHGKKRQTWETVQCQESHKDAIRELIQRDKNHPSVVMWVVANEPAGEEDGAYEYFQPLVELTKQLDPTRPVTIVNFMASTPKTCKLHTLSDVICLNRYYGWYVSGGDLETAGGMLRKELLEWRELTDKPVFLTEFGADTMHGLTSTVPAMWTEEYQCEFLRTYHRVFDELEFVIGEHVWNFADFATKQGIMRVDGNKKGVFTRDRRPKQAAYVLRERYHSIPDFHYKNQ